MSAYRRFVGVLTDANARLGADVDRYSFIVVDLHHLLLAGLPAHFESYMPWLAVRLLLRDERLGDGLPAGGKSHVALFEIDQRQRVASAPRPRPLKGAPNVVGTPVMVGIPVWVVAHVGVLGAVDADGVEGGVMPLSGGSKLITGAERFGFRATDGGLRPPPPTSVEPSGIPAGPTVDPGPMDEPKGGDAVADVAQVVGAVALMPPPSKSAVLDSPGTELPMPPDAPVVEPPIPADAPVIGLPIPVDAAVVGLPMAAGADEAPAHGAPIKGAAPDVVGLTPGVASSVAPRGIPVCPTGALGMPSGDVMPSAGRGETFIRACA